MSAIVSRAAIGLALVFAAPALGRAQDAGWAHKMFDKLSHDFGRVARGAEVRERFRIENPYVQTVRIANVRTTCGCSAASPSKTVLATGESADVEIEMDTRRFMRRKDSNLIVTFDSPQFAEVRIPVTVYIRSDVVLQPGSVNFGAVERGAEAERTVKVDYAGRDDWTIREVRTYSDHVAAEAVELSRGGGRVAYELRVRLSPTAPVGALNQQMVLVTDDESPFVPVLASARVEADITVTAPDSLGMLVPGRDKTFNVVLRGRQPFAIEKIECESDSEAFKVRLPQEARPVHVLPMTVVPPDRPGEFSEEFTVTIAGRDDPITFRVFGRIVDAAN